jgi:hypothetical protein
MRLGWAQLQLGWETRRTVKRHVVRVAGTEARCSVHYHWLNWFELEQHLTQLYISMLQEPKYHSRNRRAF